MIEYRINSLFTTVTLCTVGADIQSSVGAHLRYGSWMSVLFFLLFKMLSEAILLIMIEPGTIVLCSPQSLAVFAGNFQLEMANFLSLFMFAYLLLMKSLNVTALVMVI